MTRPVWTATSVGDVARYPLALLLWRAPSVREGAVARAPRRDSVSRSRSPLMFETLIAFSLRQRLLVVFGTVALVAGGLYAAVGLPVDATPDVTNNQVQVLTQAPALSPLEVERFVTFPVELALKSLPDVVEMRSLSRQGISVITVVFEEDVETYFGRQLILEKLREADLPDGVGTPELGPVSTGLGEIFRYTLRDTTGTYSPMELRTMQDWIVRRQLLGVPGLAEVNSIGGYLKQYQVLVDPDRLAGYGLTLREVFEATAEASGSAGAAYIETGPEQLSVRTDALVQSTEDLEDAVVATRAGGVPVTPRRRGDGRDRPGHPLRRGDAGRRGRGRHRLHDAAQGRERPRRDDGREGQDRRDPGLAPRGRRHRPVLRPDRARGPDHRDRRAQPRRGRALRHRGAPAPAREPPGRAHPRERHPALDALRRHLHAADRPDGQPHEPRGHRLRARRRRLAHRGRERPPADRQATTARRGRRR